MALIGFGGRAAYWGRNVLKPSASHGSRKPFDVCTRFIEHVLCPVGKVGISRITGHLRNRGSETTVTTVSTRPKVAVRGIDRRIDWGHVGKLLAVPADPRCHGLTVAEDVRGPNGDPLGPGIDDTGAAAANHTRAPRKAAITPVQTRRAGALRRRLAASATRTSAKATHDSPPLRTRRIRPEDAQALTVPAGSPGTKDGMALMRSHLSPATIMTRPPQPGRTCGQQPQPMPELGPSPPRASPAHRPGASRPPARSHLRHGVGAPPARTPHTTGSARRSLSGQVPPPASEQQLALRRPPGLKACPPPTEKR